MCSDIFDFQSVVVVGSLTRKSQAEIPFAVGVVGSQSKALGRGRIGVFFFFYLFNKIFAAFSLHIPLNIFRSCDSLAGTHTLESWLSVSVCVCSPSPVALLSLSFFVAFKTKKKNK